MRARWKLIGAITLVMCLTVLHATPTWGGRTTDPRLESVETFALALGVPLERERTLERLAHYDLVVVDGELSPATLIDALHDRGTLVLGYLSVGTIERGRGWTTDARAFRLEHWEDWDEWYADVADAGFRSLIVDSVAPSVLDGGFDGLFLDNVDMISGHPRQREGMLELVISLSRLVHARGGLLFAQNGEEVMTPYLALLDGWNREDVTGTYDFDTGEYVEQRPHDVRSAQRALRDIAAEGLLVTATDYIRAQDHAGVARATVNACAVGALSFVSDIELQRVPSPPLRCPS